MGPVTLTLKAPKNVPVLSPTLEASNSIFMGAGSEVIQTGLSVAMGSGGLHTEPDVLMNDTWSRGHAELRDRTKIRGTLHTVNPTLFQGVTITTRDNAPVFDPTTTLSWQINFPAGGADVPIPPDSSGSLFTGRYGTVSVGSRSTLTLNPGVYYLTKLQIEPQATVRLNQASGPIIIYVSDVFTPRGTFVSAVGGTSPDLLVGYLSTSTLFIEAPFDGAIIAPNAQLVLRSVTPAHTGFFAAKDLMVDAHAKVRYRAPLAIVGAANPPSDVCATLVPPDQVARYCTGGCTSPEDTDTDGIPNCKDLCPYDPLKSVPGTCNCGSPETDTDGDTFPDCIDLCRFDKDNTEPGPCGCKGGLLAPAGTPCSQAAACPQTTAVCDGAGVCGDPAACNPCPPNGRYISSGGSGYWLCGVPTPPTLPPIDGGPGNPDDQPEQGEPDAGTDGGTDGGTTPPPVGAQPRNNAQTACAAKGLALVRIDLPSENLLIKRLISNPLWLGANSISVANAWRWATPTSNNGDQFWTGGPTGSRVANRFANWTGGAPGAQRCAAMMPADGRWLDFDCNTSYGFVCEITRTGGGGSSDGGVGDGGTDAGDDGAPPGMQEQPTPQTSPCVPEDASGLPDNLDQLQLDHDKCVDSGICEGAAANPPAEGSTCPELTAAEAIGLEPLAGCTFFPVSNTFPCTTDDDCATLGGGLYCRQVKSDPGCHPPDAGDVDAHDPANTCEAHARCGTMSCPAIDPPRCGQVEVCNPNSEFDAGIDPGSNLDAEAYDPNKLFDGGPPDAASTAAYVDPAFGTGKNHSWCKLSPQDDASVPPAVQPPDSKSGSSGSGAKISFAFDPGLIFDVNANPLALGESEPMLHAQAKFIATASLNDFLTQSYTAPIIDVVAGVTAGRCSLSTEETHFRVLGLDFVDDEDLPHFDTSSPELSEVAYNASQACGNALAEFKLWGDRAKKAFRDAQNVLAQYHEAKKNGKIFSSDLCSQLGIAAATVPFFPGGNTCAPHEPPEVTINRLIQFYQEPGLGQITQLREATAALSNATAGLRDLLGTEIGLDFIDKGSQLSQTIVNVPFAIGPIPMVLQIDVFAKYGIKGRLDLHLSFPTNLDLMGPFSTDPEEIAKVLVSVVPHASAGLSAFVGAGVSLGPLEATIGLEGAITLAEVSTPIFAGAGLKLQTEQDTRQLPPDVLPPVSLGLNDFQFGVPKSFKFFVSYEYGAGVDLDHVLSGEVNARLRIKFFFFSRTWRKRVVRFNGLPFKHYDLVSGGSDARTTTGSRPVGDTATNVAEGQTTMGRSEAQLPLTKLALLPSPPVIFNGDILVEDAGTDAGADAGDSGVPVVIPVSKDQVENFFYDDLCCSKRFEECATHGTPACCPPFVCEVTEDGGTTGFCNTTCSPQDGDCFEDSDCCDEFGLFCGSDFKCHQGD